MTRRMEPSTNGRPGAVMHRGGAAAAPARRARSRPAAGLQNFFDNIFTGSLSKGNPTAPSAQRPGTSAQAQARPTANGAPPPWSGEDGASGHPLMTASAIREAAANFDQLRRLDVARCRAPQHLAAKLRALHRGP